MTEKLFKDTIAYLSHINADLARHVRDALGSAHALPLRHDILSDAMSASLHVNARGLHDSPNQRLALRALLLCQGLYLSPLWTERNGPLPQDWKDMSLRKWRSKSQLEITNGILLYAVTERDDVARLADVARYQLPPGEKPEHDLFLTRDSERFPSSNSCFGQVATWLFQGGFVSQLWNKRFRPNNIGQQAPDFSVFGDGQVIVGPNDALPAGRIDVPRGFIVYMHTIKQVSGHWMVSDGLGWGYGVCNSGLMPGEGEGVVSPIYARCLIHRQLRAWHDEHPSRRLVIFNPTRVNPTL